MMETLTELPPRFQCDLCKKDFISKKNLQNHKKNHCKGIVDFIVTCQYCNVKFYNKMQKSRHVKYCKDNPNCKPYQKNKNRSLVTNLKSNPTTKTKNKTNTKPDTKADTKPDTKQTDSKTVENVNKKEHDNEKQNHIRNNKKQNTNNTNNISLNTTCNDNNKIINTTDNSINDNSTTNNKITINDKSVNNYSNKNIIVNINVFGQENLEYLKDDSDIIQRVKLYGLTKVGIPKLIEEIFCNEKHKENNTIIKPSEYTSEVLIRGADGEWHTVDFGDTLVNLKNKAIALIYAYNHNRNKYNVQYTERNEREKIKDVCHNLMALFHENIPDDLFQDLGMVADDRTYKTAKIHREKFKYFVTYTMKQLYLHTKRFFYNTKGVYKHRAISKPEKRVYQHVNQLKSVNDFEEWLTSVIDKMVLQ